MLPIISVIVPVYNTSKYLARCLDSLTNQTFDRMEIILVDDGSTDSSPEICDSYAAGFSNVKCIHKENGGIDSARNAGLSVATGEFVSFVDSDDFVDKSMCESLFAASEDGKFDIVYCAVHFAWHDSRDTRVEYSFDECVSGDAVVESLADLTASPWSSDSYVVRNMAVWGALFKRSIIADNCVLFRSERQLLSEDTIFDYELYPYVNSIRYIPNPLYFYCYNTQSISRTFSVFKIDRLDSMMKFLASQAIVKENPSLLPRLIKLEILYRYNHMRSILKSNMSLFQKNKYIRVISQKNLLKNDLLLTNYSQLGPRFQYMVSVVRQRNIFALTSVILLKKLKKFASIHE